MRATALPPVSRAQPWFLSVFRACAPGFICAYFAGLKIAFAIIHVHRISYYLQGHQHADSNLDQ